MASKIRVAVIGVGHWHASRHLDSLNRAGARVVAVSERDKDVAERWGRQLGCPWFQDGGDLLDEAKPDFVFALPRHADAPAIARAVIERGLPFAIEKPLGVQAADVEPLVQLVRQRGLFTSVPFINRYGAFWGEIAALRHEGLLELLVHAHFRIVNGSPERYVRDGVDWMLNPALSGGGALRNLGIHAIDAFRFLTGEPIEVIAAVSSHRMYDLPIEEFATALLRTPSGVVATIEAGYTHALEASDQEWRVAGRGAYVIERGSELSVGTSSGVSRRTVPSVADRYAQFADDTLKRFRLDRPAVADIYDCWQAMRVIDCIYAVAERNWQSARPDQRAQ